MARIISETANTGDITQSSGHSDVYPVDLMALQGSPGSVSGNHEPRPKAGFPVPVLRFHLPDGSLRPPALFTQPPLFPLPPPILQEPPSPCGMTNCVTCPPTQWSPVHGINWPQAASSSTAAGGTEGLMPGLDLHVPLTVEIPRIPHMSAMSSPDN